MLPHAAGEQDTTRLFGTYNTVATLAGSLGALIALVGSSPHWLLAYPVAAAAGLLATARLVAGTSSSAASWRSEPLPPLHRSRGIVARLSALFALDSFGGGFVPQTFIAYLFVRKYDASPQTLAVVFFAIGILQALSFQGAVWLAARIGLLRTMVFTHLPSNFLLAAIAFAPNLSSAIALLLARSLLSQADVPTRQAYVVAVVDPSERTAAAAYTNTARYVTRPVAPLLAGVALRVGLGRPVPARRRAQERLRRRPLCALPARADSAVVFVTAYAVREIGATTPTRREPRPVARSRRAPRTAPVARRAARRTRARSSSSSRSSTIAIAPATRVRKSQ